MFLLGEHNSTHISNLSCEKPLWDGLYSTQSALFVNTAAFLPLAEITPL